MREVTEDITPTYPSEKGNQTWDTKNTFWHLFDGYITLQLQWLVFFLTLVAILATQLDIWKLQLVNSWIGSKFILRTGLAGLIQTFNRHGLLSSLLSSFQLETFWIPSECLVVTSQRLTSCQSKVKPDQENLIRCHHKKIADSWHLHQ